MKHKIKILLLLTFLTPFVNFGQIGGIVNGNGTTYENFFLPKDIEDNSIEFNKIAPKMYFSQIYLSSKVDNFKEEVYLKYNIYKDEMEFINNDKVFYLKKNLGRKISFVDLNINYEVFNYNGALAYFQVLNKNGAILLRKQNIEYQKAKPAASSYQQDKPADFVEKDDTFFIKLKEKIIELPSNKKKFFKLLDEIDINLKKFTIENKLDIKKQNDLLKIIEFYNSK